MTNPKLTKEEVSQLKYARQQRMNYILQIGNMDVTILRLQQDKAELLKALSIAEQVEAQTHKIFQEKYGQGAIDIDNGEFIKQ